MTTIDQDAVKQGAVKQGTLTNVFEMFVIGIVLVTLAACIYYARDRYYSPNNDAPAVYKLDADSVPFVIRDGISDAHDAMNKLLGWDREIDFNIDGAELNRVFTEVESMTPLTGNSALTTDLLNTLNLLNIGIQRDNVQALKMAHRVLHDLDTGINNRDALEIWNYSLTGAGNGKNVDKVEKYIHKYTE